MPVSFSVVLPALISSGFMKAASTHFHLLGIGHSLHSLPCSDPVRSPRVRRGSKRGRGRTQEEVLRQSADAGRGAGAGACVLHIPSIQPGRPRQPPRPPGAARPRVPGQRICRPAQPVGRRPVLWGRQQRCGQGAGHSGGQRPHIRVLLVVLEEARRGQDQGQTPRQGQEGGEEADGQEKGKESLQEAIKQIEAVSMTIGVNEAPLISRHCFRKFSNMNLSIGDISLNIVQ